MAFEIRYDNANSSLNSHVIWDTLYCTAMCNKYTRVASGRPAPVPDPKLVKGSPSTILNTHVHILTNQLTYTNTGVKNRPWKIFKIGDF